MQETAFICPDEETVRQALNVPVFSSLPAANVERILCASRVRTYAPGEVILAEGDPARWMFVMLSGKVEMLRQGLPFAALQRFGDVFGESVATDKVPAGATVRAVKKTICLALDLSVAERLSPDEQLVFQAVFYRVLSEKLSDRLRETDRDLARQGDLLGRYQARYGSLE